MGKVICVNGESIVCMSSDGKLTTSSTCMTPPFCVPIPYTNLGESLMADQTCSSITMGGIPVCNQKSTFKVTKGDGPGVCGGVASGTTMQIAQFKEGSKTVNFAGNPAVHNGLLMDSNNTNTGPQPLQQPPCTNPPAGTAEAPVAEKGEFSQQFDFSNYIGLIQGETKVLERPNYKITNKDGTQSWHGTLGSTGLTERVFTTEAETLLVWLGDGNWKIFAEHDHGSYEAEEAKADANTATLRIGFINFASAALTGLDYKLVVNGKETSGKTNDTGGTEPLTDIQAGAQVDILVLRETTQDYKKIGTIKALAGETHYTIVSPRVKIEAATEKHMGAATAPAPAAPAAAKGTAALTRQKTKTTITRNAAGNPLATVPEESLGNLLIDNFLKIFFHWTWSDFNTAKAATQPTQSHPRINQALLPSPIPLGKP